MKQLIKNTFTDLAEKNFHLQKSINKSKRFKKVKGLIAINYKYNVSTRVMEDHHTETQVIAKRWMVQETSPHFYNQKLPNFGKIDAFQPFKRGGTINNLGRSARKGFDNVLTYQNGRIIGNTFLGGYIGATIGALYKWNLAQTLLLQATLVGSFEAFACGCTHPLTPDSTPPGSPTGGGEINQSGSFSSFKQEENYESEVELMEDGYGYCRYLENFLDCTNNLYSDVPDSCGVESDEGSLDGDAILGLVIIFGVFVLCQVVVNRSHK